MSSAAEMTALCREIADNAASSANWKDRVASVARALGVNWSRAKGLYFAEARVIKSEEMDRARAVAREQRAKRMARQQAREFAAAAAYLRQIGANDYGRAIADLERAAQRAGAADSAMD